MTAGASTLRTRPDETVRFSAEVEGAGAGETLTFSWYYAQDYSDVEYVAARLARQRPPGRPQPLGGGAVSVTARARCRDDRAGDPLDGLVNLFDLGIVLSVAFLWRPSPRSTSPRP